MLFSFISVQKSLDAGWNFFFSLLSCYFLECRGWVKIRICVVLMDKIVLSFPWESIYFALSDGLDPKTDFWTHLRSSFLMQLLCNLLCNMKTCKTAKRSVFILPVLISPVSSCDDYINCPNQNTWLCAVRFTSSHSVQWKLDFCSRSLLCAL